MNRPASLLGMGSLLDDIALDKYTFVRDAYLQRRRSLLGDSDEPPAPDPSQDDPEAAPAMAPKPEPAQ